MFKKSFFSVVDIKFYADRSNEKKHQLSIQGDNSVTAIKGCHY